LLAQKVKMRIMPEITFVYDNSVVEGQRLDKLINEAITSDERKKT
jgi:ribosome-binding factor A